MTTLRQMEFADQIESLPPFPAVAQRALAVTSRPDSSATQVATVLREDPAIAAKILRVANSPFYGAVGEITQLSRAVARLGNKAVRNLVLGLCAQKTLAADLLRTAEHQVLWHHSIAAASACELVAREVHFTPPEEALVAGLLHDTGLLAMLILEPDRFAGLVRAGGDEINYIGQEQATFGIDHAEAGFRIVARWGLPEPLCRATQGHHQSETELLSNWDTLTAIVIVGDLFAHMVGFGLDRTVGRWSRFTAIADRLRLSEAGQLKVLAALERRTEEVVELLGDTGLEKAADQPASGADPPSAWCITDDPGGLKITQWVLLHGGLQPKCVRSAQFAWGVSPDEMVFIDAMSIGQEKAQRQASVLADCNCRRVAILTETQAGVPARQWDQTLGAYRVPRLLTHHDLRWIKEQDRP